METTTMTTTRSIDLGDGDEPDNNHIEAAAEPSVEPQISDKRREEITNEMLKLEDEINTLRQALTRKERQLQDLRTELGITRWTRLQNSEAVNKSKIAFNEATARTGQALKGFGTATANKWTEIRQSERMQSVSEKLWSATGAVKAKIVGQQKQGETEPPAAQPVTQDGQMN